MRTLIAAALVLASPAVALGASRFAADQSIAEGEAQMQVDPATARWKGHLAELDASQIGEPRAKLRVIMAARWLQGEALLRLNQPDRAAPFVESAIRLWSKVGGDPALHGDILLSHGGVHQARGEYPTALNDYQQAYAVFQRADNDRGCAMSLMLIASLYIEANDARSSLKYLNQAIGAYRGGPQLLLALYNNRALGLQNLNRFPEAEADYQKALVLANKLNSPLLAARILGNIVRVRLEAGQIAGARAMMDRALAMASHGEAAGWRPQLVALAAQVALQQHDLPRARALIEERFAGVDLATTTPQFREAHQTAYDVYRALGDDRRAIDHLAALKRLDDQATRLATSANTALAAARFDFTNQELRIATLERDDAKRTVAFEQARTRTERAIFLGTAAATAVVIALLAFGLFTIRRSRNQVRAANGDLAETNAALGDALKAKTDFLATTSHEIRTPLNGILGMTQVMLAERTLAADIRERLEVVHGAGTTMRALVDDILDVAKMESGRLVIDSAPFDLCGTLGDAVRLWQQQAEAKGLAFSRELDDCPAVIEGDVARVRQIVFNLLSNAVKFTAAGSVTLTAGRQGSHYRIAVSDTGIGIAADKREQVFESFRQADAGTTRRFGGTGLGLAICRNLARAMGGDVTLDSEPGRGSTFVVSLPLVEAVIAAEPALPAAPGRPVVLVVDRNPITRAMFNALFEPVAGRVAWAASMSEAAVQMTAADYTHVVVDDATAKADADPAAALALLVDANAAGAATVLLWSGEAPPDVASAGLTAIIAKPIAGRALVAQIFGTAPLQNPMLPLVPRAA